jgi:quercetin dioxygenase-like cupin family protein
MRRRKNMAESNYGKYFLTDLKLPESQQKGAAEYAKHATRITWLDDSVIKGAFYVSCSWYFTVSGKTLPAHTHDFDEVLGFYGSDTQNPRDLGGEIEFWLEDEKHVLNTSFLVFIPKGMKHCPLKVLRIDRPIFHFGIMLGGQYNKEESV